MDTIIPLGACPRMEADFMTELLKPNIEGLWQTLDAAWLAGARRFLSKIFTDIDFVKKGLGPSFEVIPTGLDGPIVSRPASEKEVERWIRFAIRSLAALQNRKAKAG